MEKKFLLPIVIPAVFLGLGLFMYLAQRVAGWMLARDAKKARDTLGVAELGQANPVPVSLTRNAFTSPKYENYGISVPPTTYSPSSRKPHYAPHTSSPVRTHRPSDSGSLVLPPNALNMHNKNMDSRSTLDLDGLVHPPPGFSR
ncbi:hypothetical protein DL96DRAFT_647189 [Flagelloscypha sp. PMI_526]|nr:hypothetical protein DL96DRAFT_647189 [Flagelloscypha sp. PMI_526]